MGRYVYKPVNSEPVKTVKIPLDVHYVSVDFATQHNIELQDAFLRVVIVHPGYG